MQRLGFFAALGAVVGSLIRYEVSQVVVSASFPWATFIVNILGSFFIGYFLTIPAITANDEQRVFLITGVLGGFTTFSTLAVESLQLTINLALIYIFSSIFSGTLAALIGFKFIRAKK